MADQDSHSGSVPEEIHAESAHMGQVDRVPYGPSEPDEMDVLSAHLPYDEESGTFSIVQIGDDE